MRKQHCVICNSLVLTNTYTRSLLCPECKNKQWNDIEKKILADKQSWEELQDYLQKRSIIY